MRVGVAPVRQFAKKRGINSATELARKTGLTYNTARRWWHNDVMLTRYGADVIKILAVFFGCPPGDLFAFEGESADVEQQGE